MNTDLSLIFSLVVNRRSYLNIGGIGYLMINIHLIQHRRWILCVITIYVWFYKSYCHWRNIIMVQTK